MYFWRAEFHTNSFSICCFLFSVSLLPSPLYYYYYLPFHAFRKNTILHFLYSKHYSCVILLNSLLVFFFFSSSYGFKNNLELICLMNMQLLQESFEVFENLQSASFWDMVVNVASGSWKLFLIWHEQVSFLCILKSGTVQSLTVSLWLASVTAFYLVWLSLLWSGCIIATEALLGSK